MTLEEFIRNAFGGRGVQGVFIDPSPGGSAPFAAMSGDFANGDYRLSGPQKQSALQLADDVLKLAREKGVDIRNFTDIQKVMGYDRNLRELSREELAAYLVGQSLATGTSQGVQFRSVLSPQFPINSGNLAVELGRQVFGDNNPQNSSRDTTTPESMAPIRNDSPTVRC